MALQPGQMLSHYRLLEKIGEGGMGEVYRAHDERLDRDVAIKVLPEAVAQNRDRLARFEREAKAVAKLTHSNILQIHELGKHEDQSFIVTELLEGETLRKRLEVAALDWRKAIEIGAAIADGLAAAHQAGIVHRDLKPSNIFLTNDNRVKILDFGLARTIEMPGDVDTRSPTVSKHTEPGAVMGTVGYMSPEQVRGEPADHRSDIFSLGCVLHEMISGRQAFRQATPADAMAMILREDPPALSELVREVPATLERIVTRALEKKAAHRFQSMRDLLLEMNACKQLSGRVREEEQSIVVLPFKNLSPDPEQEYFSDGLTEEIITDLSKVRSLRVISCTSAMRFKGTDTDMATIGRELNVRYVVEGGVRKAGNNLRITAQLIDAPSDRHLWTDRYDGTLDEVFEIQERVSRSIVDALKLKLSPEEDRRLGTSPIRDHRAHECYMRARHEMWILTEDSLDRALSLVERGLEMVGDDELLFAVKGWVHGQYVNMMMKSPETYAGLLEESRYCAERSLALNPNSGPGHALMALFYQQSGNPRGAIRHYERALEISPSDPDALLVLGYLRAAAGFDLAGAGKLLEKAVEVDPFNPVAQSALGWLHWLGGDFGAAVARFRELLHGLKRQPLFLLLLAWNYRASGSPDEAYQLVDQMMREMPGHIMASLALFLKHAWRGERKHALAAVSEQLEQGAWWDDFYSLCMADGYALIRDHDAAFHWLDHAIDYGIANVRFLSECDPFLKDLRTDQRFEILMDKARRLSKSLGQLS